MKTLIISMSVLFSTFTSAQTCSELSFEKNLADLTPAKPWEKIEAYSERFPSLYLGQKPYEFVVNKLESKEIVMDRKLQELATFQLSDIITKLKSKLDFEKIAIEMWPTIDESAQQTWVFARYQLNKADYVWFEHKLMEHKEVATAYRLNHSHDSVLKIATAPRVDPIFPSRKRPNANKADWKEIFLDFLAADDLYVKPLFSSCLWVNGNGKKIQHAWLPVADKEAALSKQYTDCDECLLLLSLI